MGAAVERVAGETGRGFAGRADGHDDLAFRRALAHRGAEIVGEVEHVIGAGRGAVSIDETDVLAPGAQELAVPIEHDHGMGAAVEHVDVVLAVHANRRAVPISKPGGQRAPALDHPIAVAALAQNDRLGGLGGARRAPPPRARRSPRRRPAASGSQAQQGAAPRRRRRRLRLRSARERLGAASSSRTGTFLASSRPAAPRAARRYPTVAGRGSREPTALQVSATEPTTKSRNARTFAGGTCRER